jgi:hypothetical protein
MVGLSATLPNYKDVAAFLQVCIAIYTLFYLEKTFTAFSSLCECGKMLLMWPSHTFDHMCALLLLADCLWVNTALEY